MLTPVFPRLAFESCLSTYTMNVDNKQTVQADSVHTVIVDSVHRMLTVHTTTTLVYRLHDYL